MSDIEQKRLLEAFKQNLEDAKEAHANRRAFIGFANQSAIDLTTGATKAFLLINGGAAVAMLGFVATVASKFEALSLEITSIVDALMWFGWGVLAAAMCSALAYCVMYFQAVEASHVTFTWEHPYVQENRGSKWIFALTSFAHVAAVAAGVASLVFFGLGVLSVADVIGNSSP